MARPKKQVVNYFPHSCVSGKTIFILEQKFGNDGYALWFKLLERLGASEGHFLNLNDEAEFLYLSSVSHMSEDKCISIIDCLASIEAIDKELWQENKVIWCQNFVDGLSDLYARRKVDLPTRQQAIDLTSYIVDNSSDMEKKKVWCRNIINRALKSGKIKKLPCRICGTETNIQAHHYDYDNPTEVVWLCQHHHLMLHNDQINGVNVYINPDEWDKLYPYVNINPQIKLKESKVEEKKVKKTDVGDKVDGSLFEGEPPLPDDSIIGQMWEVWKKTFPIYTADREKDFKALGEIFRFMCRQIGSPGHDPTDNEFQIKLLNTFQIVADVVAQESFWSNKPLSSIANNIQEFYNKIKNPVNGQQQQKSKNGINHKLDMDKIKEAHARRYGGRQ